MKKILIILLFILFAIPIPISILGFIMAFSWPLGSLLLGRSFLETITTWLVFIIMAAYLYTYVIALRKSWKENKITTKTFLPIAHCLLFLLCFFLLKPVNYYVDQTTPYFGFAKKDFSVVQELDTHGGFLGYGAYYLVLDCSDNKEQALEIIDDWNKLPLSENLNTAMYGGENHGVVYGIELAEEDRMPKIENGYYIFEDRHSESTDSKDDTELFNRYSMNFSIAIYDCDTDKMYYYENDT